VLKALEEQGLSPAVAAGTSFGAIVAALYALHGSASAVEQAVTAPGARTVWRQAADFGLHQASLIHGRKLQRWLDREVFRGATFDDLKLPLVIACTELERGSLVLLRSGSLAGAVMASSALPGLLSPVEVQGRFLVDGGFIEAVPFQAVQSLGPDVILGLHAGIDTAHSRFVSWLERTSRQRWARSLARTMESGSIGSPVGRLTRGVVWAARSYLRPQPVPAGALLLRTDPGIAWWDFHKSSQAVAEGTKSMRSALSAGLLAQLDSGDSLPSVA
jgi:NTE family protein